MTWNDVWMVIGAVIMSCGGAGVIIVGVASFLANMIEKRLEAKYKQILDKELESYKHELVKELENHKSSLDHRRYITKTQFDKEFAIYGELSKAFCATKSELSAISYKELVEEFDSEKERISYITHVYKKLVTLINETYDKLYENAPFIPKDIYMQYINVFDLLSTQFNEFQDKRDAVLHKQDTIDNLWTDEFENRYTIISQYMDALNTQLREYLSSLTICE